MDQRDPSNDPTRSHVWATAEGAETRVLVFWDGGFATRSLTVGTTCIVGRSQQCDLHVVHPSVSRRHVAIHAGPPVLVEDLGSVNGTRVLGRTLSAHVREPLPQGAVVEAGSASVVVQVGPRDDRPPRGLGAQAIDRARPVTEMQRLERLCNLVAASDLSVLLTGETGVGKELFAERIHRESTRSAGPFVRLNAAALPEALLESELFGHERGAFTGAVRSKPGLLETAGGGTVFLDEVGELPLATQAKLLRVLEAREVLRLGGLAPRPIDVRFVSATNRELSALVASHAFRDDLYFRLNGITLYIPPLRERVDEIAPLARAFVAFASERIKRPAPELASEAVQALEHHPWPGNVRELKNAMERAVVLAATSGTIRPEHLALTLAPDRPPGPPEPADSRTTSPLRSDVEEYERQRVLEAVRNAGGNQTRAAASLGMSRRALVTRMSAYGMTKRRAPKP